MIEQSLLRALAAAALAVSLTSCGLFGSKPTPVTSAAQGAQEFDPYSNSWKPSGRAVVPPPSEPNAALAQSKADAARENSTINKVGRAVGNTASAAGRAVKKPLEWLPFGKKEDKPTEEEMKAALPAIPVSQAKPTAQ